MTANSIQLTVPSENSIQVPRNKGRIEAMRKWCSRHPVYTTAAVVAVVSTIAFLALSNTTVLIKIPKKGAPGCCEGWCKDSDQYMNDCYETKYKSVLALLRESLF